MAPALMLKYFAVAVMLSASLLLSFPSGSAIAQDLRAPLDVVEMPALPIDGGLSTDFPLLDAPALSTQPDPSGTGLPAANTGNQSGNGAASTNPNIEPAPAFSASGNLSIEERPAPAKMVVDDIALLRPEERWSLEESLIKLRDLRNIHVYAVAVPELASGINPKELATTLGKNWAPEDAPCHGVILYTPGMTFPVAAYGGTVPATANGGYAGRVITEAMARGTAHPTTPSSFQACSLELLEELEILLNRFEIAQLDGEQMEGEQQAESSSQSTSSKISGILKGRGGPGGRLRSFLPWILAGLVGLALLACIPWFLLRKRRMTQTVDQRPTSSGEAYQTQQPSQAPGQQQQQQAYASAQPAGSIYAPRDTPPVESASHVAPPQGALPPAAGPLGEQHQPESSFGHSAGSGTKECIFPSINPEYRLQSPFAGGNNVVSLFDGSGRTAPALPSRPLSAPQQRDNLAAPTSAPPAQSQSPTSSPDNDDNDLFVY